MKNLVTCLILSISATGSIGIAAPGETENDRMAPDTILLKDGGRVAGLIVENTSQDVTIQTKVAERTIPKDAILRILDVDDSAAYFAEVHRRGTLPPWRVIANDLRTHDKVRTFEEIPATLVDVGQFRNVPYMSFRINGYVEMNIYGDPDDPAAIELGIYGMRRNDRKTHAMLRQFLAGYLTTREEISALYAIPEQGGVVKTNPLEISITPPDAPDGYGAWWVAASNPKEVDEARLSDAEYARLTRPMDEIVNKDGSVKSAAWEEESADLSDRMRQAGEDARVFLRGFYRDAQGRFQLLYKNITDPQ